MKYFIFKRGYWNSPNRIQSYTVIAESESEARGMLPDCVLADKSLRLDSSGLIEKGLIGG